MTALVGMDMGISKRLALSDGRTVKKREIDRKKLIRLQRSVSRKMKGSNNRRMAISLLAKQWQRVTDGERGYLHRLTSEIVRMHDFIAVERLETKKMLATGSWQRAYKSRLGASSLRCLTRRLRVLALR